jgi:hypothetical protein
MGSAPDDPRPDIPSGPGAAAILSAGIGCAAIGILALAGDASPVVSRWLSLYPPSGALSGVTTASILIWLSCWFVLARRWRGRTIALAPVNLAAFGLLAIGFALTFPPIMDLLHGK